jgi:hypothetical protein
MVERYSFGLRVTDTRVGRVWAGVVVATAVSWWFGAHPGINGEISGAAPRWLRYLFHSWIAIFGIATVRA